MTLTEGFQMNTKLVRIFALSVLTLFSVSLLPTSEAQAGPKARHERRKERREKRREKRKERRAHHQDAAAAPADAGAAPAPADTAPKSE